MEKKYRIIRNEEKRYVPQMKMLWFWVDVPSIEVYEANGKLHVIKRKSDWYFSEEEALDAIGVYRQFNDVKKIIGIKYIQIGKTYICVDRIAYSKPNMSYGNGNVIYSTKVWSDNWNKFVDDIKDRYVDFPVKYITENELLEIDNKLKSTNG